MSNSPILPLSNGNGSGGGGSGGDYEAGGPSMMPRSERGIPLVLRRLTKFRSMDFELAFWQLTYLVVAPRRVYKQTYHHKQTKNVWARDDPAMLLLISGCLVVTGLAWGLVYRRSFTGILTIMLKMVFRDFLLISLLTALVLYLLSNRLLLSPSTPYAASPENRVEFTYAFDVAVNAFFPLMLTLYGGLLVLGGVVVRDNWVCLFFGNTLGYAALPFVARSQLLLSPLLPIFVGYLLSLLGFNTARHVLELYFGQPWK